MFLAESAGKIKNILPINNNLILKMIEIKFDFLKIIHLLKMLK